MLVDQAVKVDPVPPEKPGSGFSGRTGALDWFSLVSTWRQVDQCDVQVGLVLTVLSPCPLSWKLLSGVVSGSRDPAQALTSATLRGRWWFGGMEPRLWTSWSSVSNAFSTSLICCI